MHFNAKKNANIGKGFKKIQALQYNNKKINSMRPALLMPPFLDEH